MADNPKDIWPKFKQDIKDGNAKVAADHKSRTSKIEKPKADYSITSGTKFLVALWMFILSFPFLILSLILLGVAGFLFWDAIFGL